MASVKLLKGDNIMFIFGLISRCITVKQEPKYIIKKTIPTNDRAKRCQ